jgi:preprotein translocase subunit SecD
VRRHVIQLVITLTLMIGPLAAVILTDTTPQLGLDLQGGISVVLAPKEGSGAQADTLGQAVNIIRNRIDSLGVAEPEVSRQGNNIIVDLPGVKDRDKALAIVGQTAELRFRPVLQSLGDENEAVTTTTTAPTTTTTTTPGATTTTAAGATTTTAAASTSTTVQRGSVVAPQATSSTTASTATTATTAPAGTPPAESTTTTTLAPLTGIVKTTDDIVDQEVVRPIREGSQEAGATRLRMGPTLMTGRDVKSARAAFESGQGWVVHLSFTGEGFDKFNNIAAQYVGQQIAIVLDGEVQSYPVIRDAKFDTNDVVISGSFKEGDAKDLALVLKYGALPVPLERQTVQDVSPSLGKDQLRAGIVAGILGLALVAVYMVLYYRLLGLVVISGLLLVGGFLYTITCWLGATVGLTLTLSGVVGIIVSAGTTVDSYIVYFERLKDEVRSGKTIRSSLDRGFARSFRTILAGNLVSLIGAALLYFLAIGSVRGFAFFLLVTTILDILVAYFFMHPVVSILGRKESFTQARWLGIAAGLGVRGATA